jgi:hypothetical protein
MVMEKYQIRWCLLYACVATTAKLSQQGATHPVVKSVQTDLHAYHGYVWPHDNPVCLVGHVGMQEHAVRTALTQHPHRGV